MAPLSWRVLPALAISTTGLVLDSDLNVDLESEFVRGKGKRPRTGEAAVPRSQDGRSYLFIAGVPGTGMGYWQGALRRCTNANICEPRSFKFYTGMLLGEESMVNETWVMKDKQHSNRIIPMNLVSPDRDRQPDSAFSRYFSWNLNGGTFENPRIDLYYKLAQANGDSLKVILLSRDSAQELLAYNMRLFKLNETEADERLAADIKSLTAQVRELPADAYRCMSFEETLGLGVNMQPLFALGEVATKALTMKLSLKAAKGANGCGFYGSGIETNYECPHRHIKAAKTRAALDALEDLCDPEDYYAQTMKSRHKASRVSGRKVQWILE